MNKIDFLLVEDNPDDAFLLKRILDKSDVIKNYHWAQDGIEALEILQATDTLLPKVVLMDIKMPGLTGLEVLEVVRKELTTKQVPIIIFSTSNQSQDIKKAYELGANSYVTKPSTYKELKEFVQLIEAYWFKYNTTSFN